MIHLLCDALKRPRVDIEIVEEVGTVGDPFSNIADITKMRELLAFEPVFGPAAGLQEMVNTYCAPAS